MRRGLVAVMLLVVIGCAKKKSAQPEPEQPQPPTAAVPVFPNQNEECTDGTVISATQTTIPFSWKPGANTESYEILIKNLENGSILAATTTKTGLDVTLNRNAPYSWYILSKSSKSDVIAKSAVWKFYNSGPGTTAYAPFPAEILSPAMGQLVTVLSGKVTLDWDGSDVDGDIVNYDIYIGTSNTPALLKDKLTVSILNDVSVNLNTTYYWKIITRDSKGNTSDSGVYQFKVK